MWISFFFVLISFLIIWLYLKWVRVSKYWAGLNVPHLPPNPLRGSLPLLQKKNTAIWLRELYQQFKTPYVGVWLFWRPALIVNSPEIARRVLVKDADFFRDRLASSGKTDPIGALNIFTVNEPIWSAMRRRLTPIFTTAKLKVMQDLIRKKTNQLCDRIKMETEAKKKIEIRDILTDYSTDIIGTAAFGVECNSILGEECAMRNITQGFQTYTALRGIGHSFIFFFPELVDLFRFSFFPKSATNYFRKVFRAVVKQRGGYDKQITENRDMVDYLLKIRQEAALDNEEISEDLLIAQAAILVQGGFETSSVAMTYICYELAHHSEIQEKLYQEVLEIKRNLGDKDFDMEVLSKAVYLNAVIKETLRKYPTLGWLDRISSKDYQIDENLIIPAGTPVFVNVVGMQWDPEYYPNPEKFIPERFLPENECNNKSFTYAPFGEGPRSCIGRRFAHQTIRFALANLTLNFELRPWPNSPTPNETKLEEHSLFLLPGEPLSVEFIPRN